MNLFLIVFLILVFPIQAAGAHLYKEKEYQDAWCAKMKGQTEYVLEDKSRVDCLIKNYAVEFDFASKWHEALGQSLYYSRMTGKRPGIVLIIEQEADWRFFTRLKIASKRKGVKIWFVSPSFLEKKYIQNR